MPEDEFTDAAQVLDAFDDRQEVVAGELTDDARKVAATVWEQDLSLAQTARVPEDLARSGVGRRVLGLDADVQITERAEAMRDGVR